jgi:transcriptional regulator with XRE-family HTH domain
MPKPASTAPRENHQAAPAAASDDDQAPALGVSVRRARLEHGLTLAALAAAVELSPSALSQIERGTINPSIVSLRRIAAALGKPVFSFLGEDPGPAQVVVRANARRTLSLPGSPVIYQLLSPDLQGRLEMLYFEVAAGGVTFEGGMVHPGEECVVLLEGQCRLEVAGQAYELEPGDAATFSSGLPHALRNVGTVPVRAISCLTPPHF